MAGAIELLEGEVVHRVVYPHPLGRVWDYAPGLGLGVFAVVLAWVLPSPQGIALTVWLDANTGPLPVALLLVLWWLGLAACLGPFTWWRRAPWPLAYGVFLGVAGGLAATLAPPLPPRAADAAVLLPSITLLGALPLAALAELRRTSTKWVLTNFRLIRREGRIHASEESWRLTRLQRADAQPRRPHALDLGDLVIFGKEAEVRIEGVRPVHALRDELELLLHTSPEAPYLGDQRDKVERVAKLLRGEP